MDQYILIIGSMKSGTTSLFSMLAQHPQIAPVEPKEPGFFAFDDIYAQGVDWYHSLFQFNPAQHRYRLDGSTDYSKAPLVGDVRKRMEGIGPAQFKLIYIMRHPLRRIESHARHTQRTRKEIGQIVSPRPDHGLDSGVSLESLAMGRYAAQLDIYKDCFDQGSLFLTTLEELKSTPDAVLQDLWRFLDLPLHEVPLEQSNKGGNRRVQHPLWGKLTANPKLNALAKSVLGPQMRQNIKAKFSKQTQITGRFTLTPEEEAMVLALLAPDLTRLRDVYGVDVEELWNLTL